MNLFSCAGPKLTVLMSFTLISWPGGTEKGGSEAISIVSAEKRLGDIWLTTRPEIVLKFVVDRIQNPFVSKTPLARTGAIIKNTGNHLFIEFRQLSAAQIKPIFGVLFQNVDLCNGFLSFSP